MRKKRELVRLAEIGRRLGVDRRQVYAWSSRRDVNGFPEVVDVVSNGGQSIPMYDWSQIEEWRATYVPSNGGRRKVV